jgi:chromosome segregation ATPase
VYARWPTPETELERVTLAHANLTQLLEEARQDVQAAEEEYASAKRILNRNAYRRKQAREKYEPMLDQLDQLTALLNRLKTEKD